MAKLKLHTEAPSLDLQSREMPAYTSTEASSILAIPRGTIDSWFFGKAAGEGYGFKRVLLPADPKHRLLSFYNLIEAHVLRALRVSKGIELSQIRKSLQYVSENSG